MSLVKTLAKVAVGVAVAKAAKGMVGGAQAQQSSGGGLGGLLGGLTGQQPQSRGGLQDMMGQVLGGSQSSGNTGGLGGLLNQLGGAKQPTGGGLQDMLGQLTGGQTGSAGGLGDLMGALGGGSSAGGLGGMLGGLAGALGGGSKGGNFGDVLNSAFDQTPQKEMTPTADQEAVAALLVTAIIQAAKADGTLDDAEKSKIIDQLGGDVDSQEAQFVQAQMQAPVDVDRLVRATPQGMEQQVYAVSVMGIDLDTKQEAQYLHELAQGYGMQPQMVNAIHDQLGAPKIYG